MKVYTRTVQPRDFDSGGTDRALAAVTVLDPDDPFARPLYERPAGQALQCRPDDRRSKPRPGMISRCSPA